MIRKSVLAMRNRFALLCLKLVVSICEPNRQLKTVSTELRYIIAANSAGSVPIFTKGLALPGSRDPGIPEVLIPNPGIEKLGPGLQSLPATMYNLRLP